MQRALPFLAILAVLVACGPVVNKSYSTRAEAASDQLFEKGWLPVFVPQSAREIKVSNDLDLNVSNGTFKFSPTDWTAFSTHLENQYALDPPFADWKDTVARYSSRGYVARGYTEESFRWVFFCNGGAGHCEYYMWLVRSTSK